MPYPTCEFCGRNDSEPNHEHIIPQWVGKEFPTGKWHAEYLQEPLLGDGVPTQVRKFPKKYLDMTTKGVCDRCNSSWMSRLEQNARLVLAPMMHNKPMVLSPVQQRLIMRWLVKTAMALELQHGKKYDRYFTARERHALMQSSFL